MTTTTNLGTCKLVDLADDRAFFWRSLSKKTQRRLDKECGEYADRGCVSLVEGRLYA